MALKGMNDFVRVRGSGYFFMPGRQCLRYLARLTAFAPSKRAAPGQPRAAE